MATGRERSLAVVQTASKEARRAKVSEMILAGKRYHEIASELGVSAQTVAHDVRCLLDQWRAESAGNIDQWTQLQVARLEAAITAIWPKVEKGSLGAIDRLISIIQAQAKLLGYERTRRGETHIETVNALQIDYSKLSAEQLRTLLELARLTKAEPPESPEAATPRIIDTADLASEEAENSRREQMAIEQWKRQKLGLPT